MIREANINDIDKIMNIVKEIIIEMHSEGNPQWSEEYPTKEIFLSDLNNKTLYVYEENNELIAFISILKSPDDEYEEVPLSKKAPSYVMHRLGIKREYRKKGIAIKLMSYGEALARKNNVFLMKADTEERNKKMNSLFQHLGYQKISTFTREEMDNTFNYYEKELKSE